MTYIHKDKKEWGSYNKNDINYGKWIKRYKNNKIYEISKLLTTTKNLLNGTNKLYGFKVGELVWVNHELYRGVGIIKHFRFLELQKRVVVTSSYPFAIIANKYGKKDLECTKEMIRKA
jgi:hypothetical protein